MMVIPKRWRTKCEQSFEDFCISKGLTITGPEYEIRFHMWQQMYMEFKKVEDQYQQLIYSVGSKFPDETRHQTALRYIHNAENVNNPAMEDKQHELSR